MPQKRLFAIDNMRAMLMICVVAGHLMEFMKFDGSGSVYAVLYSFHMPAFVFLSGLCCKSAELSAEGMWRNIIWPYVVFQTLYITVSNLIWNVEVAYQIMTPYWMLWYMMAMFNWRIMLFMAQAIKYKWLALLIALAAALLAGFDTNIGYFLTMSRTIVLFPFFLGGFYAREYSGGFEKLYENGRGRMAPARAAAVAAGAALAWYVSGNLEIFTPNALYCSMPYEWNTGDVGVRARLMAAAWLWIAALATIAPRIRIPIFTNIGQNTLTVYLLHGFIMRGLMYNSGIWWNLPRIATVIILAVGIPVLLTTKPVVFLARPFMKWPFGK